MINVLIYSHVPLWDSHHAEAVELAIREHESGNNVYFLSCVGDLETCPANPQKEYKKCFICRLQTKKTTSQTLPRGITHIKLMLTNQSYDYEFSEISNLKSFRYDSVPFGMLVYSTLTSLLNDSFFCVHVHKNKINKLLNNSISLYKKGLDIIKEHKIDKIFVWNGRRSCDGPLNYSARKLDIDYVSYISGGRYNSILLRENKVSVHDIDDAKSDLFEIVNRIENNIDRLKITQQALKYFNFASGIQSDGTNYLGYYQFSKSFSSNQNEKFFNTNKKIVSVFTGTYAEFAGVKGFDTDHTFCRNFYDGIKYIHKLSQNLNNRLFIIRWHPNSRHLNGNEYKLLMSLVNESKTMDNVLHIRPQSSFNTYTLIKNSYQVVCFGTSVAIESCLMGKPTIFIGSNFFEDLNCFYKPNNWDEFETLISKDLTVKSFNHALAWGYYFSTFSSIIYEKLVQKKPRKFYYKNKLITVKYFIIIRLFNRFFKYFSK